MNCWGGERPVDRRLERGYGRSYERKRTKAGGYMYAGTFIAQCLRGERSVDEIDAAVARWHGGDDDRDLHAALGMTRAEYARWVADPSSLTEIVASHAVRQPVPV